MVVAEGFSLDRETFACLRCAHVEQPSNPTKQAA
jgi:hypothetical protein